MGGFNGITWQSGITPCSAPNMQRYDDWIQQTEGDSGVITLNGSTSGTCKLYQIMQGTYKKFLVRANNFRNGGGSLQTITLPTPFTDVAYGVTFDMPQWKLRNGGSDITTLYYYSSISASGFGTTQITAISGVATWYTQSGVVPFDTLAFTGSQGSASTGLLIIEGI